MPQSEAVQSEEPAAGVEPDDRQAIGLQCMEIFGGSESKYDAISVPGIDASITSKPYAGAKDGGDIYYVSLCGSGNIGRFVLADVSGHGDEVAEVSGVLRRLMRKHVNTPNQARFARALNREFSQLSESGKFATAVLMTYFAPTSQLVVSNAGHPAPLWYRAEDRSWHRLGEDHDLACSRGSVKLGLHNLPLGVIDETRYSQFTVPIGKGDLVLAFTDGFAESRNDNGEMLGEDGLLEIARGLDPSDPDHLLERLNGEVFNGRYAIDDDATIMLLRHNGSSPPPQSAGAVVRTLGRLLRVLSDDPLKRIGR